MENISLPPTSMRSAKRWILCSPDKHPLSIDGRSIGATHEHEFVTFDEANTALPNVPRAAGIGYCFVKGDGIIGIDFDSVFSDGEISGWAEQLIDTLQQTTLGEISQSGSGVHFYGKGHKPDGMRSHVKCEGGKIEIYEGGRYFWWTGKTFGLVDEVRDVQDFLEEIHRESTPHPAVALVAPRGLGSSMLGVDRLEAYASKFDVPGVGQRNDCAFRFSGHLFSMVDDNGMAPSEDRVLEIMRGWNARLAEPLDDSELESAVLSGGRNGTPREIKTSRGVMASVGELSYSALLGGPNGTQCETQRRGPEGEETVEAVKVDVGSFEVREQLRIEYERFTLPELMSLDLRQEFLIDNYLVSKEPCIICGPSKSLKTTVMLDLGISLASGGKHLGSTDLQVSRQVRCGVMSGESGLPTIQESLARICRSMPVEYDEIGSNLILSSDLPKFGHPRHVDAVRRFIEQDQLEVLMIDPAYLAIPVGEGASNMFIVGELIRSISEICTKMGCMMMLIHHAKKTRTNEFEPMDLGDIAWSGFDQFARQWLMVSRRVAYKRGTGQHKLWVTSGGSAGHSGVWGVDVEEGLRSGSVNRTWDVQLLSEDEARESREGDQSRHAVNTALDRRAKLNDARFAEDEKLILKFLKKHQPCTMTRIRSGSTARQAQVPHLLEILMEGEEIAQRPNRVNGKTVVEYWLFGDAPAEGELPPKIEESPAPF